MLGNASPINFDKVREASRDDNGFTAERGIVPKDFTLGTGLPLGARADGVVGFEAVALGTPAILCVTWDDTAAETDPAVLQLTIPGDYNETVDKLYIDLYFRKFDTTGSATDNADLRIDCTPTIFKPAGTVAVALTAVQGLLAAKSAATTYAAFTKVTYNLSGNDFVRGQRIDLAFAPHEAVGTALYVQTFGGIMRWNRMSSLWDRTKRTLTRILR